MTLISIDERHLAGRSLMHKWETARTLNLDAMTIRSASGSQRAKQMADIAEAAKSGVKFAPLVIEMDYGLASPVADLATAADRVLRDYLDFATDTGIPGIIAALGSGALDRHSGASDVRQSRFTTQERLVDVIASLDDYAGSTRATLLFEPHNRFVDTIARTLADVGYLILRADATNTRISANTFDMNIEETDPAGAITRAGALLGHVHAIDSAGGIPGTGHVDWTTLVDSLRSSQFDGVITIGGSVSMSEEGIGSAVSILRRQA
jgi:D-psicose/D-tagatose/L-ribulose 3-epimerase